MLRSILFPTLLLPMSIYLTGCTKTLQVTQLSSENRDGIVYSLPKRVFDVNVVYTVTEKAKIQNQLTLSPTTEVTVEKPIVITPRLVPDLKNTFVLEGKKLSDNVLLESKLSFSYGDDGLLNAVELEAKDQTIPTIQNLVASGIQLAKVVAAAGQEKAPPTIQKLLDRIDNLHDQIAEVSSGNKDDKLTTLKNLKEELALLRDVVSDFFTVNRNTATRSEVSYTITIDPEDFVTDTNGMRQEFVIQPDGIVAGVAKTAMPKVTIVLDIPNDSSSLRIYTFRTAQEKGVVYRIPRPTQLRALVANGTQTTEVLRQIVYIPQYGKFAVARVASKGGADRTTRLTFNALTGGLKEYGVSAGSSSDKALKAAEQSFASLQQAIFDVRYNLVLQRLELEKKIKDARAALVGKPTGIDSLALLQNEKALVDAQLELAKAKKALDEYLKETGKK